jgi:tRNA(adenine34) deaminase
MTPSQALSPDALIELAYEQAALAMDAGEVPVGCVIVDSTGKVIATGQNRRERDEDPTAHAEIVAIRAAGQVLGTWRLERCALAVTLEPCPMCAGAIVNSRLATVIFGTPDPKAGAVTTLMTLCSDPRLNHTAQVLRASQEMQSRCAAQLQAFFKAQRALGKK